MNYSKTLNPLYQLASHTHFPHTAMVMMSVHIAERISFTTDLWTGCHKVKHYHTLPSPDNMQFHHQCITTKEVSVAHNAENLANEIEEMLNKWGITDYIYGATTDNA